ncbi:MAG TPA: LLM class flavin-dependent oxidoreductase [Bryobacteraceae bacterium]
MPFASQGLKLNILDQCPIPEGSDAGDALRNTLELARRADSLGYGRYWLAEHHGTPGLACNSPEVMIGPVAGVTSRMRVGSGGVMLPHYSALKVAENFSMLSALFPGRIDLGIGRAPGTSSQIAHALQRDRRQPLPDDFRQQMDELLGYFDHGAWGLHFHSPQVSLLGSSPQSALWAAEMGLPYVFADFINPGGMAMAAYYRENFRPSAALAEPRVSVAVWALAAETDEEALRVSASARMMLLSLFRGRLIPVPSVEKALAFLAQENVPIDTLPAGRRIISGSPEHVREALERVAAEYGADEVFVVNIVHDPAARLRCYELIAEAFALQTTSQTRSI